MRQIIFLQTRFPKDELELLSLFQRWNMYGEIVHQQSSSVGIWMFPVGLKRDQVKRISCYKFINVITPLGESIHLARRVIALIDHVRRHSSDFTFVCGDNQKSFMIAWCVKFFSRSNIKVQIQFHGDTYLYRSNKGIRGLVRVFFSRFAISFSDSIRIVSRFQMEEISSFSPKSRQKFVLAPIAIDHNRIAVPSDSKTIELSFIGRLHHERGITELIEIIKLVGEIRPDSKFMIAGDGPMRKYIEKHLSFLFASNRVLMPGYLGSQQIRDLYSKTKVLISPAPREGYGLTLREAALSKVCVVARQSQGAQEAQSLYPNEIKTYFKSSEAVSLILESLSGNTNVTTTNQWESQKLRDVDGLKLLVNSWLNT